MFEMRTLSPPSQSLPERRKENRNSDDIKTPSLSLSSLQRDETFHHRLVNTREFLHGDQIGRGNFVIEFLEK